MPRSVGKASGEYVSQSRKRKGRLRWEGLAEKGGFKPLRDQCNACADVILFALRGYIFFENCLIRHDNQVLSERCSTIGGLL